MAKFVNTKLVVLITLMHKFFIKNKYVATAV